MRGIGFESHWGKFPFLSLEVFQKNIYIYFQEYDNVETFYYHDVVIQSSEQKHRIMCDLKMTLGAKSCLNQCKVDTGADGNLLPINVYKRFGENMRELTTLVDKHVRLVAYNNTEIKQYGVCCIMVQFKRTTIKANFLLLSK